MHPHNQYFFNPLSDNHSLEDTPERIDSIMSEIDRSNQCNDIIIADDGDNVWSPLSNPHPKFLNEFDPSLPKRGHINPSVPNSDMELLVTSQKIKLKTSVDLDIIPKTSPLNGEHISSINDGLSDRKEPAIFNYETSTCSGTSTLPTAPCYMQLTPKSMNNNKNAGNTNEYIPFDSVKKNLLPLLQTGKKRIGLRGKERSADEIRRGHTRLSESMRQKRCISRLE